MPIQYKKYALDLYKIKLIILGVPDEGKYALLMFLQKINILRPLLRIDLTRLSKEYLSALPSTSSLLIQEIIDVNTFIMRKLTSYANQIKRKAHI